MQMNQKQLALVAQFADYFSGDQKVRAWVDAVARLPVFEAAVVYREAFLRHVAEAADDLREAEIDRDEAKAELAELEGDENRGCEELPDPMTTPLSELVH